MKKVLLIYAVLIAGILAWYFLVDKKAARNGDNDPKALALTVSKHSEAFNQSIQQLMEAYYAMTESFVNWDSAGINKNAAELKTAIDNLKIDELKADTTIHQVATGSWENIKTEINGLIGEPDIYQKRASLSLLSNELYDLLRIVRYDISKVYLQECPMALNNYETAGNWLSKTNAVRNPYLGTKDPKHGDKMIGCGEPKDTLNFMIK